MTLVVMFACLFVLQTVSSAGAVEAGDSSVGVVTPVDCAAKPGNDPGGPTSHAHASHCCLLCDHRDAKRQLLDFVVAYLGVAAELKSGGIANSFYFQKRVLHPPNSGWATSWSSRAPPAIS